MAAHGLFTHFEITIPIDKNTENNTHNNHNTSNSNCDNDKYHNDK